MKILVQIYKVIVTAIFFAAFSLGALCLSCTIFPVIKVVFKKPQSVRYANIITGYCFKFFIKSLCIAGISRVRIHGLEKIKDDKQVIYVANHPTLIDFVILDSLIVKTSCIVKGALSKSFFLHGVTHANNYVFNNEDPLSIVPKCTDILNEGSNLMIFPEGTRTTDENKLKFNNVFARIAINGNFKIRPIIIQYKGFGLRKNVPWYHTYLSLLDYEIYFLDYFDTHDFMKQNEDKELCSKAYLLSKQIRDLIQPSKSKGTFNE